MLGDKSITNFRSFDWIREDTEMDGASTSVSSCPVTTVTVLIDADVSATVILVFPAILGLNSPGDETAILGAVPTFSVDAING